ncbi:Lipase [Trema orientale]|uniref:Lipase n=1 Tax=Trema orientale TaxID=63057 RepID=A0A2P5F0X1_TREOI|nr:Lipase [Trema orientale]
MANSNHFVLQATLLLIFVSFSFSSAHFHNESHGPSHEATPAPTPPPPHVVEPPPSSHQTSVDYKGCWSKVYAFGDSSTDTGNGYLIGGLKSYASASFSKSFYSSSSGRFSGHRLSNGRLIVDHLTDALAVSSLTPYKSSSVSASYSGSVNFAIAGTSTLSRDYFYNNDIGHTFMWSRVPESYQTQLDWFSAYLLERSKRQGAEACRNDVANSLFWVGGVGGNDYIRMYGSSSSINSRMLSDLSVAHISKIIKTLLSRGAQYIVVQGLPPLGCLPSQLSMSPLTDRDKWGCSKITNAMIRIHNSLLRHRLDHFRRRYPYAVIAYADTYAAYEAILSNYQEYHFREPFKACCGSHEDGAFNFDVHCLCGSSGSTTCQDSSTYMSWDGIHFTDAMNGQLTDLFLNKGYCQPSFEDLARKKRGI